MKTIIGIVLMAGLLMIPARAGASVPEPSWNPHAHFRLIFSSSSPAGWNTGWFGTGITPPVNGNEENNYSSAHVTGGYGINLALTHTPSTAGGVTRSWTGAIINTDGRFSMTFGRVEVRAWIPGSGRTVWNWPSILLNGQHWPQDGEIDIAEGLAGTLAYHMHSSGSDGLGAKYRGSSPGWHDFGLYWSPRVVQFWYDGRYAGQITQGVPDAPEYIMIISSLGDGGSPHPAVMRIAWVRAWALSRTGSAAGSSISARSVLTAR